MGEISGCDSASFTLSNLLLCHETQSCLNEQQREDDDETVAGNWRSAGEPCSIVVGEEEEEYVSELVRSEIRRWRSESEAKTAPSRGGCTAAGDSWLRWARLDAINWILNTRANFDFHHRTAYLSISYLDLFLAKISVDESRSWAVRLLSIACLSLAAKMEECRVPGLSEFPSEDYIFESKVIQKMELLVLTTLDWKMNLITPFAYLHYFANKFFHGESIAERLVVSRTAESLLAITKEINLMDHRPSVIAAAAVLDALDSKLTRQDLELKVGSISWWISSENESLCSCYSRMQEIKEKKHRTPESAISGEIQSVYSASVEDVEESYFASGAGTKRRLFLDGSDHISSAKKTCQP